MDNISVLLEKLEEPVQSIQMLLAWEIEVVYLLDYVFEVFVVEHEKGVETFDCLEIGEAGCEESQGLVEVERKLVQTAY